MDIRKLRETINLAIYGKKTQVLGTFNVLYVLVSLFSIGVLIYNYGFHLNAQQSAFAFGLL